MTDSLVPVSVACPCPGTPHADGDTVFLAPTLSLAGGLLAEATMIRSWEKLKIDMRLKRVENTQASLAIEAALREVYVADGVRDWTFVDAEAEPIEVTEFSVRDLLISNFALARPIGDKANELYTASVLDPLLARLRKPLRTTQTARSTSANSRSSAKRPKLLKPSLTESSPTDSTVATS